MSNKMTISCEAYLADVELEEGLFVLAQDSGKVFRCIIGHDGRLTWNLEASIRYELPEASLQLQEIEFEQPGSQKTKPVRTPLPKTTYLH